MRASGPTLVIEKSSTVPFSRGSRTTADIIARVVLSRALAARKNCVSCCCSGGREQAAAINARGIIGASKTSLDLQSITRHLVLLRGRRPVVSGRASLARRRRRCLGRRGKPARSSSLSTRATDTSLVAVLEIDQAHALGRAADGADVPVGRAQDFAPLGDEQQLLVLADLGDFDDLAVLLGDLDVLQPEAAAALHPVRRRAVSACRSRARSPSAACRRA